MMSVLFVSGDSRAMKLTTKLQFGLAFTIVMTGLMGYFVTVSFLEQNENDRTLELLRHIKRHNDGFMSATHEFLLYGELRPLSQIKSNIDSLEVLLGRARRRLPAQRADLRTITTEIGKISQILDRLDQIDTHLKSIGSDSLSVRIRSRASAAALEKRLTSRILIRTEVVSTALRKISHHIRNSFLRKSRQNQYLFISLLASLVFGSLAITVWIFVSFVPPLKKLQVCARAVGVGKYDIELKIRSEDELGQLARLFNEMANELKVKDVLINKSQQISGLGSWHLDLRRDILTWSLENYHIFDREPGTPQDYASFIERVHPDDRAYVDTTYRNAIEQKVPYECVHRILRGDGEVRVVHEKSEEVVDATGKAIHSFGFTHDITEQKKIQDEKEALIAQLQESLEEIQLLRGILPICSFCKNIRNDEGYFEQIDNYLLKHADVEFSHTICPSCLKKNYPEEYAQMQKAKGDLRNQ